MVCGLQSAVCKCHTPDFADISDNRQRSVPDSPDYEFGEKWKVRQKSKLEHKCNSISATCMDAHELMLRRSQYICVLALVNARFSIMKKQKPTKRRRKRFWIREYLKQREKYGQFHTQFSELRLSDREYFFRYIRMSPERLEHLLTLVAPYIQKKACRSRDPISPAERLVVTLR